MLPGTMAEIAIRTERIDDVPLLVAQQQRMGIGAVIDALVPAHGNRSGLRVGALTECWLAYILSTADHRMSVVEGWAATIPDTLSAVVGAPVSPQDFTDDRLADVLRVLSNETTWTAIEEQLGQRLIQVYALPEAPIRLDSTTVTVYHEPEPDALFQRGHSKDHRPDLAQFKVQLAALDPLGLPLATLVVPGHRADDGLYLPAIQAAQRVVGVGGQLYVGDAKMGALATRARVQASGDAYLLPLAQVQAGPALLADLLAPVWRHEQALERILAPLDAVPDGEPAAVARLVALAYETTRSQTAVVDERRIAWDERLLVVYSPALARERRRSLEDRLRAGTAALLALTPPRRRGQRQWTDRAPLEARVQALLRQHQVADLLTVDITPDGAERPGRTDGAPPGRTTAGVRYVVTVRRNEPAIAATRRLLGWRLYVTTAPTDRLPLAQAVAVYRGAPRIERDFHRLKGKPLGIRPLYVHLPDHAQGLTHLLSLAVRVLTVVEYVVRAGLAATRETLAGLYAGNPTRTTARPTTERLCTAFKGLTLSVVQLPEQTFRHVSPLTGLQHRIVALLGLPPTLYENLLSCVIHNPP